MAKTVYFCAGWFSDKQQEAYDKSMEAIKANPTVDVTNSYIPYFIKQSELAKFDFNKSVFNYYDGAVY